MSIEFVGTMALVLIMLMIAWQGFLGMHALTQANSAARDAARAESTAAGTGGAAGMRALSESLQSGSQISCRTVGSSVICDASVQIPTIIGDGWEGMPSISRSATLPRSGG